MPFLIWLSAFSYWRRVNAEMARVTLQFLDCRTSTFSAN